MQIYLIYVWCESAGTVFKGRLWGTGVAVKKLKLGLTKEDSVNLLKEVSILSQLRHPNVVLYIGACLEPSNACIVTEWCAGVMNTHI